MFCACETLDKMLGGVHYLRILKRKPQAVKLPRGDEEIFLQKGDRNAFLWWKSRCFGRLWLYYRELSFIVRRLLLYSRELSLSRRGLWLSSGRIEFTYGLRRVPCGESGSWLCGENDSRLCNGFALAAGRKAKTLKQQQPKVVRIAGKAPQNS